MNIKKWTDEKLATTRDEIDDWCLKHSKSSWNRRVGLLIAFTGAFAISTGVVFFFFDGITAMSFVLIGLGSVACFSWHKTEQQRKTNANFLEEIKAEITRREKKTEPVKKPDVAKKSTTPEKAETATQSEVVDKSEINDETRPVEKN